MGVELLYNLVKIGSQLVWRSEICRNDAVEKNSTQQKGISGPPIEFLGIRRVRHPIYPTPPLGQDMTQGQFFKRSLAGLNSEFSFS